MKLNALTTKGAAMHTIIFLFLCLGLVGCSDGVFLADEEHPVTHEKDATSQSSREDSSSNTTDGSRPEDTDTQSQPSPPPCSVITIYHDADGDTYGNSTTAILHCVNQPYANDWTTKDGDCDDTNPKMNVSCEEKPKPTGCPNNCSDDDPYTWGYCNQEDLATCESSQTWIKVLCKPTSDTTLVPFVWVSNPNEPTVVDLNYELATLWQSGSQIFLNPKKFCESLAIPNAVLRVNALQLNPSDKSIKAIGGQHVYATDSFWWASKHNPKQGKPDSASLFDQPDYIFTFNDFPVCVEAKKEIESKGETYPPKK